MKMVFAIISSDDSNQLTNTLNQKGFSVTRLATSGGFLRAGNTTLMVGVDNENVQSVINIISEQCQTRTSIAAPGIQVSGFNDYPVEVETGGATIFVIDVERFEKI